MRFPKPRLKILPDFPLGLGLICLSFWLRGTREAFIQGVAVAVIIALSVLLHEYAHAFVAFRRGVMPVRIELHWWGGLAVLERQPYTLRDRIAFLLAGPASNLVVAALGFAALPFLGDGTAGWAAWAIAILNLGLGGFNLMPAVPLDGGRALYLLIGHRWGEPAAMRVIGLSGTLLGVAGIVLVLVGLRSGFFILFPFNLVANWRLYRRAGEARPPPPPEGAAAAPEGSAPDAQ